MAANQLLVNSMHTTSVDNDTTYYYPPDGATTAPSTVEDRVELVERDSATYSKFGANVRTNAATGTSTLRTRKNGADGGQSISVAASTTGQHEDASNTDSLTAGDTFNYVNELIVSWGAQQITYSCLRESSGSVMLSCGSELVSLSTGTTRYFSIVGSIFESATEVQRQRTFQAASTLSRLRAWCTTNSSSSGSQTVRTRKNAGNGAQSVTYAAGVTGAAEDTTNTDSLVAGDEANFSATGAGDLGFTISHIRVKSASSSAQLINTRGAAATADQYFAISGRYTSAASEANTEVTARGAFTLENLYLYISANTATAGNLYIRKNRTNTAVTVAISSGGTGVLEDTTNTVDITATDEINYFLDITSGASVTLQMMSCEMIATAGAVALRRYSLPLTGVG